MLQYSDADGPAISLHCNLCMHVSSLYFSLHQETNGDSLNGDSAALGRTLFAYQDITSWQIIFFTSNVTHTWMLDDICAFKCRGILFWRLCVVFFHRDSRYAFSSRIFKKKHITHEAFTISNTHHANPHVHAYPVAYRVA